MNKLPPKTSILIILFFALTTSCLSQEYCSRLYRTKLKIKIEGPGYFELDLGKGRLGYTRRGRFRIDCNGMIALFGKYTLNPGILIPNDQDDPNKIEKLLIAKNGIVNLKFQNSKKPTTMGVITGARFDNPEQLATYKPGIFLATEGSGSSITSVFASDGFGSIKYKATNLIP